MATAVVPAPAEVKSTPMNQVRIGTLTDEMIVDQIKMYRQESIDRLCLIMDTALKAWNQYRNKQDFSDKASWQSKVTLAKAHAAVKHFVANMMRLLTQSEQWITVENVEDHLEQSFAPYVERGILKMADIVQFRMPVRDAIENGAVTAISCLKVIWQLDPDNVAFIRDEGGQPVLVNQTRLEGKVGITSIDPWRCHFGPRTTAGRNIDYFIEDLPETDLASLYKMGGFENLDQIRDEDNKPKESETHDKTRKDFQDSRESRQRKRVLLWHYWGDLIDPKTQQIVAENQSIMVANGKTIIKFGDNQLWDKKPPYIVFSPLIVGNRFPGGSILEMNLELKEAIDRIAQMWEDHQKFSVLPMWEAEMAALENPEDVFTGVMPGKIYRKKPGTGPVQIFRPLLTNPISADSFNTVLAFDKEYQRGTFITEQVQGLIDSKGETTATEVQQTQISSTLMLSDIAMILEDSCFCHLGEAIWDRMFQFMDYTSDPNWEMLLGPPFGPLLDRLPMQQRMALVQGNYTFKAYGLSRTIERQQQLQALIQWAQTLAQIPAASAIVNWAEVIRRGNESFHMPNPDELLMPNWPQVLVQAQQALMQQQSPIAQQQAHMQAGIINAQARNQGDIQLAEKQGQMDILLELVKQLGDKNKEKPNGQSN